MSGSNGEASVPAPWQEMEEQAQSLRCLIERLPDEERREAACWLVAELAVAGGDDMVDWLGILERAKLAMWDNCMEEQEVDEEED